MTVDRVIADAQDEASPLHECFEWDVKRAAIEHWREQARALIQSVHVKITVDHVVIVVPVYVRDPERRKDEQGYVEVMKIKSKTELAKETMMNEIDMAESAIKRAHNVATVLGLAKECERLLTAVVRFREHAEKT